MLLTITVIPSVVFGLQECLRFPGCCLVGEKNSNFLHILWKVEICYSVSVRITLIPGALPDW